MAFPPRRWGYIVMHVNWKLRVSDRAAVICLPSGTYTMHTTSRFLIALAGAAALAVALPARAEHLMQATVTGVISTGFDAYRNSVYFGNEGGYNLNGLTATATIIYDADLAGPNYPGYAPNWLFSHAPNYPSFQGLEGGGPVKSASFTVNGVAVASDVTGPYEDHDLRVENPGFDATWGQRDSWLLSGYDARRNWCPNDSQCIETVQLSAYQTYTDDLFGGQRPFNPADAFVAALAPTRVIQAYVRMMQGPICLEGGWRAGACPDGRFTDGQSHWVEFTINGTQLTVAPLAAVPEPQGWMLALLGLLVGGLALRRGGHKRAATAACVGLLTASAAQAESIKVTLEGTLSAGSFDAYYNTVGVPYPQSLVGKTATFELIYDSSQVGPNLMGTPNAKYDHSPYINDGNSVPGTAFITSANFTVNGLSVPVDVSGLVERHRIYMESGAPGGYGQDRLYFTGADFRGPGQLGESIQIMADTSPGFGNALFHGALYDPSHAYSFVAGAGVSLSGVVRFWEGPGCYSVPMGNPYCSGPHRFADSDTATHWAELWLQGTRLTIAPAAPVPEPQAWAFLLLGMGFVAFKLRR